MTSMQKAAIGILAMAVGALTTGPAAAQEPTPEQMQQMMEEMMQRFEAAGGHTGPVIDEYGSVVPVGDRDVPVPADHQYKVYFDAMMPEQDIDGTNAVMSSAARFLNMQVEAGVPIENLDLAVVIYGPSTEAALGHEEFRARYGTDNPNVPLMEALAEAGVDLYLCGQTAVAFGVTMENKAAPVKMALSAMTMFALLQADGYVKVH